MGPSLRFGALAAVALVFAFACGSSTSGAASSAGGGGAETDADDGDGCGTCGPGERCFGAGDSVWICCAIACDLAAGSCCDIGDAAPDVDGGDAGTCQ